MQQVLPALQRLSEDDDSAVQVAAIDGLAQLLPLYGSNPEMAGRLYSHFDELVTSNQPKVSILVRSAFFLPDCCVPGHSKKAIVRLDRGASCCLRQTLAVRLHPIKHLPLLPQVRGGGRAAPRSGG